LLVGALSGGAACGVEGIPDIYSRFTGDVYKWAHDTLKERFGVVDVPIPKPNGTASGSSVGIEHTAGGFYYSDGKCHDYNIKDVPVSREKVASDNF